MRFTAAIIQEDSWYVARCLEVEVASQGRSQEEALSNLKEALELFFEDEEIPGPFPVPTIAQLDIELKPKE